MNIDATNHVLGRLATDVVQHLKDGEEVDIYNAEKAIVKGKPEQIADNYRRKYNRGSRDHGPYYPKAPERILKRTIKGMLPDTKEGRKMLKKVKAYKGDTDEDTEIVDDARVERLRGSNHLTLGEISDRIGGEK